MERNQQRFYATVVTVIFGLIAFLFGEHPSLPWRQQASLQGITFYQLNQVPTQAVGPILFGALVELSKS